jgi:DNA-3-methyladenine glycosylase
VTPLGAPWFARDAHVVAPDLLNKVLVVGACSGRIVEVEAYTRDDPASHSHRGETTRNAVMFGAAGHLYVYFTYGMHFCANVVTGQIGDGQAVLLRALQPLSGVQDMVRRRGRSTNLADGPGKLCQALGIDLAHNGVRVYGGGEIRIVDDGTTPPATPRVGPRVGITKGVETQWRWRV